jgi:hypothetical protein
MKVKKVWKGCKQHSTHDCKKPGSNWGVSTGLHYSRITERMNLQYTYLRSDTTQGIISINGFLKTGDTITTIYGDIITQTRITGTTKSHYTLSTFDIPLSLFYEKDFEGWSLGCRSRSVLQSRIGE